MKKVLLKIGSWLIGSEIIYILLAQGPEHTFKPAELLLAPFLIPLTILWINPLLFLVVLVVFTGLIVFGSVKKYSSIIWYYGILLAAIFPLSFFVILKMFFHGEL